MTTRHQPREVLELVDDPKAPETYVDETAGYAMVNGTVCLTFEAFRWEYARPGNPPKRVVINRIRMPIAAAQNLAVGLFDFLSKQGLDPTRKLPDAKVQ